jgi:hypothetical protein
MGWTQRDCDMLDKLIWGTMVVDMGEITDANIGEWLFRMRLGDRMMGGDGYFTMKYERKKRFAITAAHLRKFVGLKTNVSTITRAQWLKKALAQASERVESLVSSELQKEAMAV